jgi:G10 protein
MIVSLENNLTFLFIAETEPHEGKRRVESLWPIFKIHHQKSRYVYDLYYRRKAISKGIFFSNYSCIGFSLCAYLILIKKILMKFYVLELYEYCLKEKIADANLIAKWKKQGYENLCCLRCIQTRDTNFGTNCICRVPKGKLEEVNSNFWTFTDASCLYDIK